MINYGPVLSELPRFLGAPIPSLLDLIRDAPGGQSITITVRSTRVHFRLASVGDKLKARVVNNRGYYSSDCIFESSRVSSQALIPRNIDVKYIYENFENVLN